MIAAKQTQDFSHSSKKNLEKQNKKIPCENDRKNEQAEAPAAPATAKPTAGHLVGCSPNSPTTNNKRTSETTNSSASGSTSKCNGNQKIDQTKQAKGNSSQQETRSERKQKSAISEAEADSRDHDALKKVEVCDTSRDTSLSRVPTTTTTNGGPAPPANNNTPPQSLPTSKFQQRQQRFLAAAAKSSTPSHLKRQQAAAAAAANGTSSGRPSESAWRSPLLPTLLARVNNSPHIFRQQQQQQQQQQLQRQQIPPPSKPQAVVNQHQQQQQQHHHHHHQLAAKTNAKARPTACKERVTARAPADCASIRGEFELSSTQGQPAREQHTMSSTGSSSKSSSSSFQCSPLAKSAPNVACPSALMTDDSVTTCGDNCSQLDKHHDCVVPVELSASQDTAVVMKKASTTECADINQQRGKTASSSSELQKQQIEQVRQADGRDDSARRKTNQSQVGFHCNSAASVGGHQASLLGGHNNNNNSTNYNSHYQSHYHNQLHNYQPSTATSTSTTTPAAAVAPRNIMAHYKFHNDCQSSVLTYEQVKRLDFVMDQTVPIHGRGNTPTLYVKLKELIRLVKYKLQHEHSIEIRDVRLNGGAASYVLAPENSQYNDLDLIFGTDLTNEDRFDVIRDVVLECLMEFYPDGKQQNQHQQTQDQHRQMDGHSSEFPVESLPNYDHSTLANDGCATDHDDLADPSKSNRSSSFESDNLNITISSGLDEATDENVTDDETAGAACGDDDNNLEPDNQAGKAQQTGGVEQQARSTEPIDAKITQQINVISPISHQHQMPPNSNCAIKEAYVHKMVKVNDDDRWSLISLGVQQSDANNCMQQQQQQQHQQQQVHANIVPLTSFVTNNQELSDPKANNVQSMIMEQQNFNDQQEFCSDCHKLQSQVEHSLEQQQQHRQQQKQSRFPPQQKQFPNSIELKFVDKMRRKFEFSVDSFQIILDSLIQFYDYAPQSTITIQRTHPSNTTMSGTKSAHEQSTCCSCPKQPDGDEPNDYQKGRDAQSYPNIDNYFGSVKQLHNYGTSQNCSRNYYQLPIEPTNSASEVSVASSSGCSSSSSVVSSSSSSLSFDDDHEDNYRDADSPPSSSSASTSSLLCSTAISLLSSSSAESTCAKKIESESQQQHKSTIKSNSKPSRSSKLMNAVAKSETNNTSKVGSVNGCCGRQQQNLTSDKTHVNSGHLKQLQQPSDFGTRTTTTTTTTTTTYSKTTTASCAVISENFYPTVIGRSEYGNFKEALYHLEKKLIATRSPEEIRGGGLLKYCNLLVKNYKPTNVHQIRTLERYMCSRFFIDFSDLNQQRAKLESYLANHFSDDPVQKFDYLTILHNVVQRSTVCLMNHELRLTMNMIRELAFRLSENQRIAQQVQQQNNQQLISGGVTTGHQQKQKQQQQQYQGQQAAAAQGSLTHERQQHQQQYYPQQDPVVMQSGVYRVKLVNYALAKPVKS